MCCDISSKTEVPWHDERDGVMGWGEDKVAVGAWNDANRWVVAGGRVARKRRFCRAATVFSSGIGRGNDKVTDGLPRDKNVIAWPKGSNRGAKRT